MNIILLFGATLGLSSLIMAAFIDHYLALHLSAKLLSSVITALRYHQLYAIVICLLGITSSFQPTSIIRQWLIRSAYTFCIGLILFSFSIYISAMTDIHALLYLTPAGGIILMIGWVFLIRTALIKKQYD